MFGEDRGLASAGKSEKNRGEQGDEGAAEIALSYISQLFDNAGDTEPRGAR